MCGSVFCGKCCKPDLLLYYEDNVKVQKAKAALIGIVGCPDKEPTVSIYLPICQLCYVVFEEYQVIIDDTYIHVWKNIEWYSWKCFGPSTWPLCQYKVSVPVGVYVANLVKSRSWFKPLFWQFCCYEISKNTFYYRTPLVAASVL